MSMLMDRAHEAIAQIDEDERHLAQLLEDIERKQQEREAHRERTLILEQVRAFIQKFAVMTRQVIVAGLEEIVTTCLQIAFDERYSFRIEVDTSRNETGVEFIVLKQTTDGLIELPPTDNMGGGVIDVVAIALSFGLLKVMENPPDGPILYDEPAKMISGDRVLPIARIIQELRPLFGRQVILVTHHDLIADSLDRSYRVSQEDGVVKVVLERE